MPTFRAAPSTDLRSAVQRALSSRDAAGNPLLEMQADQAAATTARNLSLADKARAEVEAMQRSEAERRDPNIAAQYAGNVAGINGPDATRLSNHLRGVLEQPGPSDIDDAAAMGREAQPFLTGAPNVGAPQTRLFQSALASTIANRIATGKTSADQLAHAGDRINETALTNQAANEPDVPTANRIVAAVAGKVREPYKLSPQGVVLNEETGDVNEGTKLAGAVRTLAGARTSQASSAAAASRAKAPGSPASGDEPTATLPGGVGTKLMQEAESGTKYAVNEKTGRAWKASEKGWEPVLVTNLPKNLTKFGAGTPGTGNRESVFTQRVIQSANQAAKDLHNVVQLPMTASTGMLGGRKQGPGLFDATKEVLANKLTSQEVQSYNVMSTGFQRSLAAIESAGLMPSGSLTHQMDAVLFKEGDTNLTKLHKLAQTRQIVESGMDTILNNPRVSEMEKNHARSIVATLQKAVPFTHEDLIKLSAAQEINPSATLKDVVGKGGGGAQAMPKNANGWTLHVDANGNQAYVSPDGKQFEEVK